MSTTAKVTIQIDSAVLSNKLSISCLFVFRVVGVLVVLLVTMRINTYLSSFLFFLNFFSSFLCDTDFGDVYINEANWCLYNSTNVVAVGGNGTDPSPVFTAFVEP